MTKTAYDEDEKPERSDPDIPRPDTLNTLSTIIATWTDRHQGQATLLHPHPTEAARAWIKMQEPPGPGEAPSIVDKKGGGKTWSTPYLNRIAHNLTKFLRHGTAERNLIIAAHIEGIPWRGDEIEDFKRIIEETETMHQAIREFGREGFDAYRKCAVRRMMGFSAVSVVDA